MWRSGTKKKARAVLAISWRCCEIQGREEALSRGAGLLESQQEENLDLMRRQQGGELGRRMNFVTSINQAAQQWNTLDDIHIHITNAPEKSSTAWVALRYAATRI